MADVTISLTSDEALVLFDLLNRWDDLGSIGPAALRDGEQVALWNLSGALERVLVEPFREDYSAQVAEARARLAGPAGS